MTDSVKILPAVVICCGLLFGLKSVGLWTDVQNELAGISEAQAAGKPKEAQKPSKTKTTQKSESHQEHGNDEDDHAKMNQDGHSDHSAHSDTHETDAHDFSSTDLVPSAYMSASEVEVLQSLSERRRKIDERQKELDLREKLLAAAEQKVDDKITELKAIEANIKSLLRQKDEEEEAQIESLVKVYETMKAKDAARIFERLDNDILLDVAMRMKEAKVAAIMGAMSADSAENLTVLLATSISEPADLPFLEEDEDLAFGANG